MGAASGFSLDRNWVVSKDEAVTPKEFEDYVSFVIGQLDCFKSGTVSRNRRFPGVRQPGEYEVDIALNAKIDGVIDFFLIVECKNWSRPIDRPVVQKFEQTKQALSAQKAAIVSPIGFTGEAIDVANALGIALWVVAESKSSLTVISGLGPSQAATEKLDRRLSELAEIGFDPLRPETDETGGVRPAPFLPGLSPILVEARGSRESSVQAPFRLFSAQRVSGSGTAGESCRPGLDPQMAMTEVADEVLRLKFGAGR